MKVVVNQVKAQVDVSPQEVLAMIVDKYRMGKSCKASIYKESIDARHGTVKKVYSILIESERFPKRLLDDKNCSVLKEEVRELAKARKRESPPIVVGFGPCGIFAALTMARAGMNPIVIERGADVDRRAVAVQNFFGGGALDSECNVQFGEGGAGTFSDGKLVTRTGDIRNREILETLVKHGASERILTMAKPHVGTDKLREVIKSIRQEIVELGGTVHFDTRLESFEIENGKLVAISTSKGDFPVKELILATGHSAHDVFELCKEFEIDMEKKPFSVGMRIEHKQSYIDGIMYGSFAGSEHLPPAEYQMSHRIGERGCYTFCMCPGGVVIPAASYHGGLCVNGMSNSKRNSGIANSAVVASVLPSDLHEDIFSGIEFAKKIEESAFVLGGGDYTAPFESAKSYLLGEAATSIQPTYSRGVKEAKLSTLFPSFINDMIAKGLANFDRKYNGFATEGVLTGVETRTSSPIRILRNDSLMSSVKGIFPSGEGAGYAGGIMSAAADGMRVAEYIISL